MSLEHAVRGMAWNPTELRRLHGIVHEKAALDVQVECCF